MGDPRIDRIAARQAAQTAATRLTVAPLMADTVKMSDEQASKLGVSIGSSTSSQARSNSGSVFRLGRRTPSSGQRGRSGKFAGLYICPAALADPRIAAHSAAGLAP